MRVSPLDRWAWGLMAIFTTIYFVVAVLTSAEFAEFAATMIFGLPLGFYLGVAMIIITHNLNVISFIADRVAVMYLGKILELARTEDLFSRPRHPYTEALMSAIPRPDPRPRERRILLTGQVANPAAPPSGCYFHPRCKYAIDICSQEAPELVELRPDHFVSCHRAQELDLEGVGGPRKEFEKGLSPAEEG